MWDFERLETWRAPGSALRRSKPNVALPPKESLTQADLSVRLLLHHSPALNTRSLQPSTSQRLCVSLHACKHGSRASALGPEAVLPSEPGAACRSGSCMVRLSYTAGVCQGIKTMWLSLVTLA